MRLSTFLVAALVSALPARSESAGFEGLPDANQRGRRLGESIAADQIPRSAEPALGDFAREAFAAPEADSTTAPYNSKLWDTTTSLLLDRARTKGRCSRQAVLSFYYSAYHGQPSYLREAATLCPADVRSHLPRLVGSLPESPVRIPELWLILARLSLDLRSTQRPLLQEVALELQARAARTTGSERARLLQLASEQTRLDQLSAPFQLDPKRMSLDGAHVAPRTSVPVPRASGTEVELPPTLRIAAGQVSFQPLLRTDPPDAGQQAALSSGAAAGSPRCEPAFKP